MPSRPPPPRRRRPQDNDRRRTDDGISQSRPAHVTTSGAAALNLAWSLEGAGPRTPRAGTYLTGSKWDSLGEAVDTSTLNFGFHCVVRIADHGNDGRGAAPADVVEEPLILEPRWPPVVSLVVFMGLTIGLRLWLPQERLVGGPWAAPAIELLLLVVLLTADPGTRTKRTRWLRPTSIALVGLLVVVALWATAVLIYHLITGAKVTEEPGPLLAAGTLVWLGNNLAFALMYWLMDSGGPIIRALQPLPIDFAFTQHMSPELAPPGWRPVFLDYLHLGFTNATAFSPTDVLPLTYRAKYAMLVQSTIALALFGLIVARAVNAFT